jgi:hypothetical protein
MELPPDVGVQMEREVAEQLVARTRSEGVGLVGPKGLLGGLTRRVLKAAWKPR